MRPAISLNRDYFIHYQSSVGLEAYQSYSTTGGFHTHVLLCRDVVLGIYSG